MRTGFDMDQGKTAQTPLVQEIHKEELQSIVEKYDIESRYRRPAGFPKIVVSVWLIAMSLFHLYTAGIGLLPTSIHRAVHLTFAIVAVFLLYPGRKGQDKTRIPWYDWILAATAGVGTGYIVFFFNEIARRGAQVQPHEVWLGVLTIVMVLEAGRRVAGKVLPTLSILFLLYCYFGRYMPYMFMHRGYSINRIIQHMYLTQEGIFGVALGVSSTFVFMFILFGAFLAKSGGARFFNELALAIAGHSPGGPAKVAIVASGLLGTINGSSVANVATTGAFTIPLMKKVGYKPEFAGAVEACASTGGQFMPPIMGAGAFIMSEFLGISYLRIAAAAIIPAVLYYSALFIAVHLRARHRNLEGLSKEVLPALKDVLVKDGHLVVPLVVIIGMLLNRFTPLAAAFWGIISVVAVSLVRKHTRMGIRETLGALEEGARGALGVAIACALVGFIVGTSSLTALGLTISNNIIDISKGLLFPTLLLSMVACLILGMGLPTTANYIVTSTMIAPALIKMGVLPLAAHLFVFYFGIMADLTPPVCLAAFTGAGIAGGNPSTTGFQATRIALVAYLIPYTFIYTPVILLEGATWLPLTIVIVASMAGVMGLAAALQGWMFDKLNVPVRAILLAASFAAFLPDYRLKVISALFIAGSLATIKFFSNRKVSQAA
ncbi:MAG: TRAP transporter, 4TM/12TM fusion protein [Synergistales bacterium 58_81]|nr:MAG: TRAP transporter, 4TM/12TM fusion protein [Synergistales bacterium 57_84]KUK88774.1 MAG: TRAP transporter, 4TM/12TM fusion protein [Synergistales bacterium 58_81]